MAEPLRSRDKKVVPLTRPPEIEACVARLESVDAAVRLKAFAIMSKKSNGYIPSKALTHFCVALGSSAQKASSRRYSNCSCGLTSSRCAQPSRARARPRRIGRP